MELELDEREEESSLDFSVGRCCCLRRSRIRLTRSFLRSVSETIISWTLDAAELVEPTLMSSQSLTNVVIGMLYVGSSMGTLGGEVSEGVPV